MARDDASRSPTPGRTAHTQETPAHHGIDYVELPVVASDFAQVEAFYSSAFGWRFNKYGPKYMGFIDGARGSREAGGFALAESATRCATQPLIMLYSTALEASRQAVLDAGGTLSKDIYDFPGGRCFEFKDPSDNALACWSQPSGDPNPAHRIHHAIDQIEFSTTDFTGTEAFYAAAFGWRFTKYGPKFMGYIDGARGDTERGGFVLVESVGLGGPLVVLYSNELEASFESMKAAGGIPTKKIFEFPGGRRFEFKDPSGNELACWCKI